MNTEENEDYKPSQTWNKKDKNSNMISYVLIAVVCFMLAWVMI
ncbi:MAG: hypothetical protein R8M45_04775 [Ghiorsea sp.]